MSHDIQSHDMQEQIHNLLNDKLNPSFLEVINESHMHNVPKNSETHFKVIVVTELFNDKKLIARQRMVNDVLKAEMTQIHALAQKTFTPEEWKTKQLLNHESPDCMHKN